MHRTCLSCFIFSTIIAGRVMSNPFRFDVTKGYSFAHIFHAVEDIRINVRYSIIICIRISLDYLSKERSFVKYFMRC